MTYKLRSFALGLLTAVLTISGAAQAETIFLTCDQGADYGDNRFKHFTVDSTNNSVNNLPATINATSIDWAKEEGCSNCTSSYVVTDTMRYHLDRVTGTLTSTVIYHRPDGTDQSVPSSLAVPCTVGSAPATKF